MKAETSCDIMGGRFNLALRLIQAVAVADHQTSVRCPQQFPKSQGDIVTLFFCEKIKSFFSITADKEEHNPLQLRFFT